MKRDPQAQGPSETAPTSDEGPTVATVAPWKASKTRALILTVLPTLDKPCV